MSSPPPDVAADLTVAVLSDVLDGRGLRHQVLEPEVGALLGGAGVRCAGPAFPVLCAPAAGTETWLDQGAAAVDAIPAGSVVVVATGRSLAAAAWGELLSTRAVALGAVGAVTDGAVRDLPGIAAIGFPVWAAGTTPRDGRGRQSMVAFGVRVVCGAVTVEPGDLVVADADGVVVVPADIAASVIGEARAGRAKEQEARRRLSEGGSAQEVLGDLGVL